jgi:hypothetical protein
LKFNFNHRLVNAASVASVGKKREEATWWSLLLVLAMDQAGKTGVRAGGEEQIRLVLRGGGCCAMCGGEERGSTGQRRHRSLLLFVRSPELRDEGGAQGRVRAAYGNLGEEVADGGFHTCAADGAREWPACRSRSRHCWAACGEERRRLRREEEKMERRMREVRVGSWDGSSKNRLQVVFAKTKRILIFLLHVQVNFKLRI